MTGSKKKIESIDTNDLLGTRLQRAIEEAKKAKGEKLTPRERSDIEYAVRCEDIRILAESGTLVVRQMTEEERNQARRDKQRFLEDKDV
jgi:hypothetical protein